MESIAHEYDERDYAEEAPEVAEPMQPAVATIESAFDALISREDTEVNASAAAEGPPAESRKRVHEEEITMQPEGSWLLIDNLVRPFTDNSLRQLISATGNVKDCWLPKFKTHAVIQLESFAQAEATKAAVQGIQWPHGTNKKLTSKHITEEEARELKAGAAVAALSAPRPDVAAAAGKRGGIAAAAAAAAAAATTENKRMKVAPGKESALRNADKPEDRAVKSKDKGGQERGGASTAAPRTGIIAAIKESLRQKGSGDDRDRREGQALNLDDLFRKTVTKPCIYWLPNA